MQFDLMTGNLTWARSAELAKALEAAGFSGMLFTEAGSVPWMQISAAAQAAPSLDFSTGIAVAFPRSPMISAQIAWELAENTRGRFRMGLGSQVKGHIERRYSAQWDKPAPQMRDYVGAFKACIRAFRREERLDYQGRYYSMNLLPAQWQPTRHDHEDIKIDISAVGPIMCGVAGELCDGIHVHPMHSMAYINNRLLPAVTKGAARAGRDPGEVDLMIPVFAVAGDTEEERARMKARAKTQIAFYGSTPNYAFQFDDLGFEGTTARLGALMRAGDLEAMAATISDEMLEHYAVVASWDDMADRLLERYRGTAGRVVVYLGESQMRRDPDHLARWGEIARAVRAARFPPFQGDHMTISYQFSL